MFATADDMRARFGEDVLVQVTDQAEWNAQAIAAINMKLADASVIAEGFVAKYYAPVPGRTVPPLLTQIVCAIAFASLYREPSEAVQDRASQAMKMLEKISTGLIKIDQGAQDIPAREGAVIVPDRARVFSRDSLGGF